MRWKPLSKHTLRTASWSALLAVGAIVAVGWSVHRGIAAQELEPQAALQPPAAEPPPAQPQPGPPGEGLRGILAFEAPRGLLLDDFETLPPSWQAWGAETAGEIEKLYNADLDTAGQRAQIGELRARIETMNKAIGDPAYRAIRAQLVTLRGRLARRVVVAEAILNTLALDTPDRHVARIESARTLVVAKAEALRDTLAKKNGGDAWFQFVNGAAVVALADPEVTVESRRPELEQTLAALAQRGTVADESQKRFLSRPEFVALETPLVQLLTITAEPVSVDGLRDKLAELVAALEDYESTNNQEAAVAVRGILKDLQANAPDGGGPIVEVALAHYLNYNLRVVAGEEFFRTFVAECRLENRPVRDCFMGTSIRGSSTTNSAVDFTLVDNPHAAEFEIFVHGDINSSTTGYNKDATVFTHGNHHFEARKRVRFDGDRFTATQADIHVDANNNTYAARSKFTKVPILGKIADKIALKEARKRRPASEAFARMRVSQQALPEFNGEVDDRLAETNNDLWNDVNPRLHSTGLYPEVFDYYTTNHELVANFRVVGAGELSGGAPIDVSVPSNGLAVRLHEGYVNNMLDRMGLAGQTLTETELRARIADFLSSVAGREVTVDPPDEEDGSKFALAAQDPIRVRFDDGQLFLTLRTGLVREGEADIPEQEITVPLRYELQGSVIHVTRGTVQVSLKGGLGVAAVLRRRIQQAIPEERTRDAWVEVDRDNGGKLPLYVRTLEFLDGWLVLALEK